MTTAQEDAARRADHGTWRPRCGVGDLLQLTVDLCPFGTRLLFWQVRVTVQRHGEIFDLAAEQPEPPFSVHCAGPVLQLARVDRHENLIPRQAVL
jgi:hypothetical protein